MKQFLKDTSGHTALMFVGAAFGILGAVGYAVDYAAIRDNHTELQAQVDAAVLALSKSGADTYEEQKDVVMGAMLSNGFSSSSPIPQFKVGDNGFIRVRAETNYDTMVMGLFGKKQVKVVADAESAIAREADVEIVMVLDTTGSMSGSKLDNLKVAATNLVNTIAVFDDAEVKIGLVPYSNYVNIGMGNRNASWADIPADRTWTETYTYQPRRMVSAGTPPTCTGSETYTYTTNNDGIVTTHTGTRPTGCTGGTAAVYENDGPPVTATRDMSETWHGCVGSRNDPLNERDDSYTNHIPGLMNTYCANPISPLTTNYGQLRNDITALTASQNTYMPAGVVWGWRALSSKAPFSEGAMSGGNEKKIMIIMTDGINTLMPSGNNHVSTSNNGDKVAVDKLTEDICDNAKNDGIEVYTVAFEVPDNATKQMLERCATSSDHYFDATNAGRLVSAFRNITARIINVRLTE